mmetsp:Transcript_2540/g.4729  ORF Transcript_2540/g.4729 Transcript_2540/m.4729 type:complete len:320 (+) Transcript_2540:1138-2097(+)
MGCVVHGQDRGLGEEKVLGLVRRASRHRLHLEQEAAQRRVGDLVPLPRELLPNLLASGVVPGHSLRVGGQEVRVGGQQGQHDAHELPMCHYHHVRDGLRRARCRPGGGLGSVLRGAVEDQAQGLLAPRQELVPALDLRLRVLLHQPVVEDGAAGLHPLVLPDLGVVGPRLLAELRLEDPKPALPEQCGHLERGASTVLGMNGLRCGPGARQVRRHDLADVPVVLLDALRHGLGLPEAVLVQIRGGVPLDDAQSVLGGLPVPHEGDDDGVHGASHGQLRVSRKRVHVLVAQVVGDVPLLADLQDAQLEPHHRARHRAHGD